MRYMLPPDYTTPHEDVGIPGEIVILPNTLAAIHPEGGNEERSMTQSSGSIMLTKNLWDALTAVVVRDNGSELDGMLWVDFICIHQEDSAERAAQVLLMGDIYSLAESVLIWLSKDADGLDTVVWMHDVVYPALIAASKKQASRDALYIWMNQFDPIDPNFWTREMEISDVTSHSEWVWRWQLYWEFFANRTWFQRAWVCMSHVMFTNLYLMARMQQVVQEVLLAPKLSVLCGETLFSWEDMIDFLTILYNTKWYQDIRINVVSEKHKQALVPIFDLIRLSSSFDTANLLESKYLQRRAKKFGARSEIEYWSLLLIELIRCARTRLCLYPEDKVISLLGLLRKFLPAKSYGLLDTRPDSGAVEIYTWIATLCIENSCSLFFLNRKEDPSHCSLPDLPSWVPDFCSLFFPGAVDAVPAFDATLTKTWEYISPRIAGHELQVHGLSVEMVKSRADQHTDQDPDIVSCLQFATGLNITYQATGQDRVEALWRTLIMDCCGNGRATNPAPNELGESFHQFVISEFMERVNKNEEGVMPDSKNETELTNLIMRLRTSTMSESLLVSPENFRQLSFQGTESVSTKEDAIFARTYRTEFNRSYSHRVLFQTSTGLIGIGPPSLQPDDNIFLLQGGRTPFILRELPKSGTYELVGGCYVHGIMHGELMTDELRARFEKIRIV
jgi:hypothetical protein